MWFKLFFWVIMLVVSLRSITISGLIKIMRDFLELDKTADETA